MTLLAKHSRQARLSRLIVGAAVLAATMSQALANETSQSAAPAPGTIVDYGLSAGISLMSMGNTHFGLGQLNANLSHDIARTEAYIAPRVNVMHNAADSSSFYGGLRAVSSFTRGDGDSWGLTVGRHWQYVAPPQMPEVIGKNQSYNSIDSAYVGWKSGKSLVAKGIDELDVSFGPQNFQLGDGMVLVDGNDEANQRKGIYWLDPRQAWKNTALVKLGINPVRGEFFALNSDRDSFSDTIVGLNLELVDEKLGKVGTSYFKVTDSDLLSRDGLSVTNVHARGRPFAALPTLELAGEYNIQKNDQPDVDAKAWFVEGSFFMPWLPWYPTVGYRYASFSGDKAHTSKNEGWDYLHNGATSRGFGYWYQGIVTGTYETRLSNLNTHFFNLTLVPPIQGSWLKVLYYDHSFNDKSTASLSGGPVSSDSFSSEWNLMLGYSPSKKVDYIAIYGRAEPGRGGEERYASIVPGKDTGKTATMLQFTVLVHF